MANASKYMNDILPINVCGATITDNSDMFTGSPSSDVINMANWTECFFLIQKGSGAAGTTKVTVESCDDVTPTTATEIKFQYRVQTTYDTWGDWTEVSVAATGFTTTAGEIQLYQIRINAESLSSTDQYVRLSTAEVDGTAVDGSIIAWLAGPRYSQETPASVIV